MKALEDQYQNNSIRRCFPLELCALTDHLLPGRARGGMADAPDLGSGSERIGGSSPLARTIPPGLVVSVTGTKVCLSRTHFPSLLAESNFASPTKQRSRTNVRPGV